jgi:hypothetical protein
MGALLIIWHHRASGVSKQSMVGALVAETRRSVSLDYCSGWNNALKKVIIRPRISPYRRSIGATGRDFPQAGLRIEFAFIWFVSAGEWK